MRNSYTKGYKLVLLALCSIFLIQCVSDEVMDESDILRIRLSSEPDRLNPILSRQGTAVQIERFIFSPLLDYNPFTMELEPILLESRPDIEFIDGEAGSDTRMEMVIRDDAYWDDGSPITGLDYLFSMKVALNPYVANQSWANYISKITSISVDSLDQRRITVLLSGKYILSEEIAGGFQVYPRHIYDPQGVYDSISYMKCLNYRPDADPSLDTQLREYAEIFNSDRYSREIVQGSGPYEFVEWVSGQHIVLQKKAEWWGKGKTDLHPFLRTGADQLHYLIIPDNQTALTALKDGQLDVVSSISPEDFTDLQRYNDENGGLELLTPPVLQYYAIAYNNGHPVLSRVKVRQALSRLMDVDELIEQLFYGMGLRVQGPVHPTKPYYNELLTPIPFEPAKAKELLAEDGWQDSDKDGVLDQVINGKMERMEFSFLTTRSKLSQDVAILLAENAADAGINIEISPVDNIGQRIEAGDYDLSTVAIRQNPGITDPYSNWHSENQEAGGNNFTKFSNPEADRIMEQLRITLDPVKIDQLMRQLQQIIYDEQPALFLVAPKTRLAVRDVFEVSESSVRPGFFENMIIRK